MHIIPLVTYFPKHGGGCSQKWEFARYVCVYYSLDHLFHKHGGGCPKKRELQCLYVYIIPFNTNFPKHGGGCSHKWEFQCMYMYIIPLVTYFPDMEGVAHRNENWNVCMCILFPRSPIFPTWMGLLTEIRIAMSVCVYYTLITYFTKHGGGCWEKCELQCLCVCMIPLITYFPNMEGVVHRNEKCNVYVYIIPLITFFPNKGVAHRNENCNVCTCILFPWSPISLTRMCSSQKWELQCLYVYIIPINTNFPKHGVGCSHKWDLQCLYVYIIP